MKKGTKLLLGGLTVAVAAAGAIGAVIMKTDGKARRRGRAPSGDSWARPGMTVTFRAELMPGRDAEQRTFKVTDLLPSGRVLLDRVAGEHAQKEFEHRQD
jgi:hypothetical protein